MPGRRLRFALFAWALLAARVVEAQLAANGKTLTATTANAVATFSGPDLVGFVNSLAGESYLKKPSSGDLAQVDAITNTGQALQSSSWTIGSEPGTGVPLATITSQDSVRTFTLTVKIDAATQEIVLKASAGVTSGGVRGAAWSIAGLDLAAGRWIVPANSGAVFDAANLGVNAFIAYPNSWQAQMAVYEGAAGSLLVYSTDTQHFFKQLRQTTRGDTTLDVAVYTEATAPWPSAAVVPATEWRLKAFPGDWRAAARPFRDWMIATYPPVSNAAHPWVSSILAVAAMNADASLLGPLAAKVDPSKTLIYLPNWRQSDYDVNYPDYTPASGVAAFVTAAHALGFKVMLHTDIIGVAPTNADYAAVQKYQARTPDGSQLMGWNWDQPSNPGRYGLIDPAASAFRSLWITRIAAAVNAAHPDALHLDFTAMYNDGNGPIEGRTFTQGEDLFNQQIIAAFPNLALGCEEEFDFTYRYHSFAQAGLWAFISRGHPISAFLSSPQVLYYGHLATPPVSDPAFTSNFDQVQRRSILPMWWVLGASDLDTTNVDNARFIGLIQSFQSNQFSPAWTADWTGDLLRYQGIGGSTASLTDTGQLLALKAPLSPLFQLAHDANQLTSGSFIDRWPAFDDTTLYGLNPASRYFVDPGPRPDATHVTSLPIGIQLVGDTLVTPSFAQVRFAPPAPFDFTDLSRARFGIRYQGADYPIGFGAVVAIQTHVVGGESRTGIFIHPPWQGQVGGETFAEYTVPVSTGAALRFSVGVDDGASCTDGVTFGVTVNGTEIWSRNFSRGAWHDAAVNLAAYAETTVALRLISNPGPAGNPGCDAASWTNVLIAAPTPAIDVPLTMASGSIFSGIDAASWSPASSTSGTVSGVPVPGGFTIFTRPGSTVGSGTDLTTLPFDVWSWDKISVLLQAGSVFGAGAIGGQTSGGVTKDPAIWAHPPNGGRTVLSWALHLPASQLKLGWSAGVVDGAYSDDGVVFDVRINGLSYWSLITGVHGDNHWTPGQLDLSHWKGQNVLLELVTDSRSNWNYDWAAWADLALSSSTASCSYNVPASASVGSLGGSLTVNVTATATCPWAAASNALWLTVTGGSGAGSGSVSYDVAANPGASRSGTLTIAGSNFTVSQGAAPGAALSFHPVTPCRILDTRNPTGPLGGPAIGASGSRTFTLTNVCGVPPDAGAISANVTTVNQGATGEIVLYSNDLSEPDASTTSFHAQRTRANNTMLGLASDGSVAVKNRSGGALDLIIDVNGYFR
jgi:hypothetical protein